MVFPQGKDEELLAARLSDLAQLAQRGSPRFSFFLTARERALAEVVFRGEGCSRFLFTGGYGDAERTVAGVFPDWAELPESAEALAEAFPVVPVTFSYRKADKLSHRDFLGSLMALRLKRETVGDILVGEGLAVVFIYATVAETVLSGIDRIGSVGVSVRAGAPEVLPAGAGYKELSGTVSSLRIDAVLAMAAGLSREEAAEAIRAGLVQVEHSPCERVSRELREGETFSARGRGKFRLETVGAETRKGRLHIQVRQYL